MNYHTIVTPEDESIWAQIISLEGQSFRTARGLEYTYRIKRSKDGFLLGEILFERKEKSVTRATLLLAYQNAVAVQQTEGCVSGPKKLVVFGASYLYPIFLHLGICSRRPEVDNQLKEDETMPRPKGRKNKKKRIAVEGMSIEELIAQRTEAKAALEAEQDEVAAVVAEQKATLKALKAEIKKLDKELAQLEAQKSAAESAAAAEAAKAALQGKIDDLLAQGKSLDDIMNMLK